MSDNYPEIKFELTKDNQVHIIGPDDIVPLGDAIEMLNDYYKMYQKESVENKKLLKTINNIKECCYKKIKRAKTVESVAGYIKYWKNGMLEVTDDIIEIIN